MNANHTDAQPSPLQRRSGALPLNIALPFSERRVLLAITDIVLVNGSAVLALWLWRGADGGWSMPLIAATMQGHWRWLPILSMTWLALGWLFDLYDITLSTRKLAMLPHLGLAMASLILGYVAVYFLAPVESLPRRFFVTFALAATLSIGLWRYTYAAVTTLPQMLRRTLIVGAGWSGRTCLELLQTQASKLHNVIGFVDDDPAKRETVIGGVPVLGNCHTLEHLIAEHRIDKVVVAITGSMQDELFRTLVTCRAKGLSVVRMPELYETLTRQVPVEHIDMGWVLNAMDDFESAARLENGLRRLLDLLGALLGLIVLGLVLPFVALAIALDDHGPLFYRQERAGQAGKPIELIKFRSMCTDAEKDGTPQWAKEHDDRITRVGRFLRKTRLDELPQVINVFRGDMHLVGPRPERPAFIETLEQQIPFYRTRLIVKPGLTGWAQIHYEYGNSVEDAKIKLQYDLYYIRRRSLVMDVYVILKTVGVVLRMGGM